MDKKKSNIERIKEIKSRRRSEILQAARKVIAEVGFSKVSMDMVAKKAKISKGALYLYFSSKDELFYSAIEEAFDNLKERAFKSLKTSDSSAEKIGKIILAHLKDTEKYQDFLKVFFVEKMWEIMTSENPSYAKLRETRISYENFIAEIIKEGCERGNFRKMDEKKAAFVLVEMIKSSFISKILNFPCGETSIDADFLKECFLKGISKC